MSIRLLVLDVDGVLSDGKLYLGPDGQEWRSSHVRDGHGIKKAISGGIAVAVISGRGPGGMDERLAKLGIEHRHWGCQNKVPALQELMQVYNCKPENVAMMGDDEPDLDLMERVAIALCPADAIPAVCERADFVSQYGGGQGAVREAIEWLLARA